MWKLFRETVLWVISGIVLWHCAHSITLIFPLPGPWLPTEVAWAVGGIMACLGCTLFGSYRGQNSKSSTLFHFLGLFVGAYLGWTSARGALAQQGQSLPPSETDRVLSAVVCGTLGLVANGGMYWLIMKSGDRPFRVLSFLLCVLLLIFAAVSVLVVSQGKYP